MQAIPYKTRNDSLIEQQSSRELNQASYASHHLTRLLPQCAGQIAIALIYGSGALATAEPLAW